MAYLPLLPVLRSAPTSIPALNLSLVSRSAPTSFPTLRLPIMLEAPTALAQEQFESVDVGFAALQTFVRNKGFAIVKRRSRLKGPEGALSEVCVACN